MSDSTWNDPRITAYVLDELSADERKEFERELQGNAELQAAVTEAGTVTDQLEGLFAAEPIPALDLDRRKQIVAHPPSATSWKVPMIALATAASLMLLVGGPIWWNRDRPIILGSLSEQASVETANEELSDLANEAGESFDQRSAQAMPKLSKSRPADADAESNAAPQVAAVEMMADTTEVADLEVSADNSPAAIENDDFSSQAATPPAVAKEANRAVEVERIESQTRSELKRIDNASPAGTSRRRPSARIVPKASQSDLYDVDGPDSSERSAGAAFGQAGRSMPLAERGRSSDDRASQAPSDAFGREDKRPAVKIGFDGLSGVPANNEAILAENESFGFRPMRRQRFGAEDGVRRSVQLGGRVNPDPPIVPRALSVSAGSEGTGPGSSGDQFDPITDNPFQRVSEHPLSTFSVDVDTAGYSKTRDFLMRANGLPNRDAVRIEEMINYFDYDYEPPAADAADPFTTHTVVTSCPWNEEHRLARIALKGKEIEKQDRPQCNLVFLLDTSGSMDQPTRLPLVVEGMRMLLKQLDKQDRVAIVVYAGSAGLVLDSTPARKKKKIRKALAALDAGGSTNGGAGIALAYQTARDHFIKDGVNRVILCTDGDFNVGTTSRDALVRMVEQEAKGGIFLSVLGFGMGNHNDAMLEKISGQGNGNYAFIDHRAEAQKVLVEQASATLVTIAKDVKLQVEFNPKQVSSYRLIGYENRVLAKQDFNDDKKDAGEIGAGHAVTALYEIVPAGVDADDVRPAVDALKYQSDAGTTEAAESGELMTLKLRYKEPDGETSKLIEFAVTDDGNEFEAAKRDVRFAAAVAGFGMQLRRSDYKGNWTLSDVQRVAESAIGSDEQGLRKEFVELVRKAGELMGRE